MKKFKRLAYIITILFLIVCGLIIYLIVSKKQRVEPKEKVLAETRYLGNKVVALLNEMNQIEMTNYKISVSDIPSQKSQKTANQGSSSGGNSGDTGNQGESESGGEGGEQGSGGSGGEGGQSGGGAGDPAGSTEKEKAKQFELKRNGVLTSNENVDWDNVKSEVEILYSSLPNITLDLYQANSNQNDVLKINQEFDNLTKAVQEENKEKTMGELSKVYEAVYNSAQNIAGDGLEKSVAETKMHILKAYSKIDTQDWDSIAGDIQNGINAYSKLVTDTKIDERKHYTINKGYVLLNELQNAVKLKDKKIFLIKYKNLLEELDKI